MVTLHSTVRKYKFFLDNGRFERYNSEVTYGLVAQLGAHHIRIVGVEGSNPFKSTRKQTCVSRSAFSYFCSTRSLRKLCPANGYAAVPRPLKITSGDPKRE